MAMFTQRHGGFAVLACALAPALLTGAALSAWPPHQHAMQLAGAVLLMSGAVAAMARRGQRAPARAGVPQAPPVDAVAALVQAERCKLARHSAAAAQAVDQLIQAATRRAAGLPGKARRAAPLQPYRLDSSPLFKFPD